MENSDNFSVFSSTPPPDAWTQFASFALPLLWAAITLAMLVGFVVLGVALFHYLRAQTKLAVLQTRILEEQHTPPTEQKPLV